MATLVSRVPFVRAVGLTLAALALATFSGCGGTGSTVPLHSTTGQVLLQGKPVEGVQVTFHSVAGAGKDTTTPVPFARTDKDGKFQITTAVGPDGQALNGAPAGDYLVTLVLSRSDSADFLKRPANGSTIPSIDARFANPTTSGLKATIKPGENALEAFQVTEAGGGPAGRTTNRD